MNDGCRPASVEHEREHRRGRRLAVGAGHGDGARVAAIAASISARRSTGCPRSRPSTTSRLRSGMAVETVTASTSSRRFAAWWPTCTSTPAARSRSSPADSFRSLPDTRWPIAASTLAMALMPAPPTPTTWMDRGRAGRRDAATRRVLRHGRAPRPAARHGRRRHGRRTVSHGLGHRGQAGRIGEQRVELVGQAIAVSSSSGTRIAPPARMSTAALAVWWSRGRWAAARGPPAARPRPARRRWCPRRGSPPGRPRRAAGPCGPRSAPLGTAGPSAGSSGGCAELVPVAGADDVADRDVARSRHSGSSREPRR